MLSLMRLSENHGPTPKKKPTIKYPIGQCNERVCGDAVCNLPVRQGSQAHSTALSMRLNGCKPNCSIEIQFRNIVIENGKMTILNIIA